MAHRPSPDPSSDDAVAPPVGGNAGERAPGHRRRGRRDLTTGGIRRNLWYMSWPQMTAGVFNAADQLVDLFWAGRVAGVESIAGVGVAQTYARLAMLARQGIDVGMQALIARAIGLRRVDVANNVALQAFVLGLTISTIIAVAGLFAAATLLAFVRIGGDGMAEAVLYFQVQLVGAGVQGFRGTTGDALHASGDPFTPMQSTLVSRVVHFIITPFLIFGLAGLPAMGIAGAAFANIIGQGIGAAWNLWALHSGQSRLRIRFSKYRPDFPMMCRLVKIGAPAAVTQGERGFSELALIWIVSPFGDSAIAAFSLTRRLERLTNIGSQGVGRASGVMVGQNLGAGHPERARSAIKWAITYVIVIRGSLGVVLVAFPALFIVPFTDDPGFVEAASAWVRIQALAGVALGAGQVFQQSFNVAGDTWAPMIVTLVSMWTVEVPFAWVLSRYTPMEELGVPAAIALSMFLRVAFFGGYYLTGRWMRVDVLHRAHGGGPPPGAEEAIRG